MAEPSRLRPEDRPDFEAVLHLAPSTTDIRGALGADPTGRAAARLRACAPAHADDIAAAAGEPYRACLAVPRAARHEAWGPLGAGSPLPALAVLTPLVAAMSAGVLLLLGSLLQVADVPGPLPGSLLAAGWTLALVAAVTGLLALAAPLRTALGRRGAATAGRVGHARPAWRQALLDLGMLPHLRGQPAPRPEAAMTPCSPPDTLAPCPARAGKDRTPCSD
ncbi:hypothetical protein GCM10010313_23080 [Streptomyces violarus]|uniref:Uncharacterized protein n=1 Tax=Streptomyces violarus TaxID=67380 RepID=A0A7W4ZTY2_9ACTN|nr:MULTISPECIES: hypothetical protein [Streptomyces]MBB3078568.1 hypothetical protein [Streptomyces violarus]WRU03109.1 hypothetical protein VJ737_37855 [Streptomyces sp. CGMCC 4.1772]GHD05795.1 hypothetical protein GCM10010313_23080 [Streptomyces violarus]